jgi:hypothetical protein
MAAAATLSSGMYSGGTALAKGEAVAEIQYQEQRQAEVHHAQRYLLPGR